jgi:hypothetical protein
MVAFLPKILAFPAVGDKVTSVDLMKDCITATLH